MGNLQKQVTLEELQAAIPSRKNSITQEVVDIINNSQSEPEFQGESLLQTATTYESVLRNSKAGIKDYLNAIRFSAYLISMDDNYTEAYKKTFYDREFVKERMNAPTNTTMYTELTSAASRYRKSKLVVDILTLSQVPLGLIFTGARHKAVGVLIDVMSTAKLDRDKINAAKELLAATTPPETKKIELDIGVQKDNVIDRYESMINELVRTQKAQIEEGKDLKAVTNVDIIATHDREDYIEAEVIDD